MEIVASGTAKSYLMTRRLSGFRTALATESTFGRENTTKWVRCQQIAARAGRVLEQPEVARQLPPIQVADSPSSASGKVTADDWLSRFWDDAGLVSDETLQEIYARILASEAVRPGSCSLRTLRVLRYLDRDTAENFTKLMPGVFDASWVPSEKSLQDELGIDYSLLLDLSDAGLVKSSPLVSNTVISDQLLIPYGRFILNLENCKGLQYGIHPLTKPGRELARIAQVARNQKNFMSMARWIIGKKPDVKSKWAELTYEGWQVNAAELTWQDLPSESAQE